MKVTTWEMQRFAVAVGAVSGFVAIAARKGEAGGEYEDRLLGKPCTLNAIQTWEEIHAWLMSFHKRCLKLLEEKGGAE